MVVVHQNVDIRERSCRLCESIYNILSPALSVRWITSDGHNMSTMTNIVRRRHVEWLSVLSMRRLSSWVGNLKWRLLPVVFIRQPTAHVLWTDRSRGATFVTKRSLINAFAPPARPTTVDVTWRWRRRRHFCTAGRTANETSFRKRHQCQRRRLIYACPPESISS